MFAVLTIIGLPFVLFAPGVSHNSHLVLLIGLSIGFFAASYQGSPIIRCFLFYLCAHFVMNIITLKVTKSSYTELLFILAGIGVLLSVIHSRDIGFKKWCDVMCITCLLQASVALLQWFGVDVAALFYTNTKWGSTPVAGFLGNTGYMANYLAITLPFFFRPRWIWLAILPVFVIMISQCLGAVFALCVGAVVLLWTQGDRRVRVFVVCAAGALLVGFNLYLNDNPALLTNSRFDVWGQTLGGMIDGGWQKIVFGFGAGAFFTNHIDYYLHNDFLLIFYKYGVIGIGLVGWYLVRALSWYNVPGVLRASVLAMAACMLASNLVQFAPSAMLSLALIGLLERRFSIGDALYEARSRLL